MSLKSTQGGLITASPPTPTGPFSSDKASGVWTMYEAAYWGAQSLWPIPGNNPVIGEPYGGGYYVGQISTTGDGVANYNLVVGPLSTAQSTGNWKTVNTATSGTDSTIDGPANSAAMNNATHPAAYFCEGLTIGGYSDWYLPALYELELCYYNLKPTTTANYTVAPYGNPYAVPPRASNYTSGTPAQTSSANFITGGAQAFSTGNYWASTQGGTTAAWTRQFSQGYQRANSKNSNYTIRAIRRVAL